MSTQSMMLRKIKEINISKLNKLAGDIARKNNKSIFYVKMDMFINFVRLGIGYTDYLKGDYINLNKNQKKTFVTTKSFYKLLSYLNDKKYLATMSDKIIFNKIFNKYLGRKWIDLRVTNIDNFKKFIKENNVLFAKPPKDFGGHGIKKIIVSDIDDINKLYDELKQEGLYLLEEEIIQIDELSKINPFAVNSFRVVTLVKDGKPHILANALRINIDESVAIGCSDVYMRLSEDGKISSRVVDDVANIYEEHPITKIKFKDVKIPYIKEAFDLALKAAMEVPEVRYVGWDIAITKNGPVIVEGNEYPSYGVVQYYLFNNEHEGHLKKIADILGDEMKKIGL